MKNVVISEKWDKKAQKYAVAEVPFPFKSKEVYESSIRQPLGREVSKRTRPPRCMKRLSVWCWELLPGLLQSSAARLLRCAITPPPRPSSHSGASAIALILAALVFPFRAQFNPDSSFRNLTRPAVLKSSGVVIDPARFSQAAAKAAAGGAMTDARGVATVAGGMSVQARAPVEKKRKGQAGQEKKAGGGKRSKASS